VNALRHAVVVPPVEEQAARNALLGGGTPSNQPQRPPSYRSTPSIAPSETYTYESSRRELFKDARAPKASFGAQDLDKPYDQYGAQQEQVQDEDEETEAIKQQIKYTKSESVASTRNALRAAREAEETARNTLTKLGDQTGKLPHLRTG
jgi:hypothetical protein